MKNLELNLVDGQSRHGDRYASQAAAALSAPKQGTQRQRVLRALAIMDDTDTPPVYYGFTSEQIAHKVMDLGYHAIRIDILRRRITDLVQLGWVEATHDKRTGNYHRRPMTMWVLSNEARARRQEILRGT